MGRKNWLFKLGIIAGWTVCQGGAWSNEQQQAAYMRRCIVLANQAEAAGGFPYGALIADPKVGEILAEGKNDASLNPTLHGEIVAINNLTEQLGGVPVYNVAGNLELYTTAEPCPMCMGAIAWSGFGRVIYGTTIPFIESQGTDQIDIRATSVASAASWSNVTVIGGVLSNETDLLYMKCGSACHHAHDHTHDHDPFH